MTKSLRTPEHRFFNLPKYPFEPNFIDALEGYEGLRVHYLDEGSPTSEEVFLCLHGQPTWSYLYRRMIPSFAGAGVRIVAPDLLGFGKSDKPVSDTVYTFSFHREMLIAFIKALDLTNITLVCQDWGGILGLTIPPEFPERFSRLLIMNTAFPVGESLGQGFDAWKAFNRANPDLDVAQVMKMATPSLTDEEAAAYSAPFPNKDYKAGVRRFPELVMIEPDMNGIEIVKKARTWWATEWSGECFMAIGADDIVLGPHIMRPLSSFIRGCPQPMELNGVGHFVQEHGEVVAQAALHHFDIK
ncbi:MAG: haloalkane dehalogenase [Pseudomonadota bacterium]